MRSLSKDGDSKRNELQLRLSASLRCEKAPDRAEQKIAYEENILNDHPCRSENCSFCRDASTEGVSLVKPLTCTPKGERT